MNPLVEFIDQANFVWVKGGSLMPALGLLALYLYYLAFDLWLRLRAVIPSDLRAFPREKWGAFKGVAGWTALYAIAWQTIATPRKPGAGLSGYAQVNPPTLTVVCAFSLYWPPQPR